MTHDPEQPEPIMSIDDAPYRVRREHYRRHRRASALAIAIIATALGLIAWAIVRLIS